VTEENDGGILSFLDDVVEIETICQPVLGGTIPEEEPEEEEEAERKPRNYREREFESLICQEMDGLGVQYERQKRIATGIIDIFVYRQPPEIIEVKPAATPYYLMQAAVQLKFYETCFKKAYLYVAVPGGIDEKWLKILANFGIGEYRYG
jgi:hypothetical protein